MLVVVVEFEVKPEHGDAFVPAPLENARLSVDTEPGCRQFDVCADPERPHAVFLYELYDDRSAFDAHCRTSHFLRFEERTRDMVIEKRVRLMARLHPRGL